MRLVRLFALALGGLFSILLLTAPAAVNAQVKKISQQQVDSWIQTAINDTRSSDISYASAAVIAEQNTGKHKFPSPSYSQVTILCNKLSDAETTGGYVVEGAAENACEGWEADTSKLERVVVHYYNTVLLLRDNPTRQIPECSSSETASTLSTNCTPTDGQIQQMANAVAANRNALRLSVVQSNAQAVLTAAEEELEDAQCPSQAAIDSGVEDRPTNPEYTGGKTCAELRAAVASAKTAEEQASSAADEASGDGETCSINDLGGCLISILARIVAEIERIILFVAAAILGFANYLLGWTVYITVFQFGNLVGNSEGLLAAWGVVRDVANILLLFGFIFMGISTILNLPHSEFTAKKALPTLIIFALLVNFSLLAAEGVIDVSNAFATSIYDQISGGEVCQDGDSEGCAFRDGIGGRLMQMSGVGGIWDRNQVSALSASGTTAAIVYGGLIIFVVITTLVLIAATVMLLIRAVILAFLMVTSPIGFAGMAVPPLQEIAKKWWDQLIQQAVFAPVYFLLVLISFKVMEGVMTALNTGGGSTETLAAIFGTAAAEGRISNITIGITFMLIIGFMIAALMFAKQSSAIGSGVAIKAGGSFAFGGLGFVGRQTAGRASLLAANRIRTSRFGQTGIGRMAFNVANKGASSSFDFRQSNSAPLKGLTKVAGDLGTTRKSVQHGMHGIEEAAKKRKVDYAKQIDQTHAEAHRQDELEAENRQEQADRQAAEAARRPEENRLRGEVQNTQRDNADRAAARGRQIASAQADLNQAVAAGDDAGAQNLQNQVDQLLAVNARLSQEEQDALTQRRQELEAHQQATQEALQEYDRRIGRNNAEINGGTFEGETFTGITKDAKRRAYGENMRDSVLSKLAGRLPGSTLLPGGIAGHTDYEAGREVIRNAGRTGVDRAVRDLQDALGGGGGAQPPAPPPPAGGGGGGAHP